MSKINDEKSAKAGIASLFGMKEKPLDIAPAEPVQLSTEELLETIEDTETREKLKRNLSRRQYGNSGRPRKGEGPREVGYTRKTYLVNDEKAEKLAELSIEQTKFLKELLDEALDLLFEKYNK